MPKKTATGSPYLAEYVYDLLWNITPEVKKKLSRKYWHLTTSSTRARNFADFSTLEEKMLLFSELDIEYAIIFSQEKIKNTNSLKKVLAMYESDRQAGAAQEISGLKVFVTSDKELSFLLSLMAQTIHHKSYFLNQQLNKTAYHIQNWSKSRITTEGQELREAVEGASIIDRTILNCAINLDLTQGIFGVTPLDMKVLLYLNQYRHTYIEKEIVVEYFAGYNKKKISTSLKRLKLKDFLRTHTDLTNLRYTLTNIGIKTVGDFRNLILKQNQF